MWMSKHIYELLSEMVVLYEAHNLSIWGVISLTGALWP